MECYEEKMIITNLTLNYLVMKIVQSLFIHKFLCFTHKSYALKTHLAHEYIRWYKIRSFIGSYFIYHHMYSYVLICFQCTLIHVQNAWIYQWINFTQLTLLNCWMLNLWWYLSHEFKDDEHHTNKMYINVLFELMSSFIFSSHNLICLNYNGNYSRCT
jgi:hypothetical protein